MELLSVSSAFAKTRESIIESIMISLGQDGECDTGLFSE
jgi:hypothetical protein